MEKKTTSLELTDQEIKDLDFYIVLTRKHRQEEQEACETLSKETNDDGTPVYPKMKDNAEFMKKLNENIEIIAEKLIGIYPKGETE